MQDIIYKFGVFIWIASIRKYFISLISDPGEIYMYNHTIVPVQYKQP